MRWLLLILLLTACEGASTELGLDAILRVRDAQFRPGAFPAAEGGPPALAAQTAHATVVAGRFDEQLLATLDQGATSAIIGVAGLDGAWIVPAGVASPSLPGRPTIRAVVGFSAQAPLGPIELQVAASDADGAVGASVLVPVIVAAEAPPDGLLVIGLEWGGTADLDLHVVDPLGGEAYSDDPNTWVPPPPGQPVPPNAHEVGGILDHDGNEDCRRDGRPSEHVVWRLPPPPGGYTVRVDARSMCRDASSPWYVAVTHEGETLGAARGIATPEDVQQPHGPGSGITALEFTIP